MSSEYLESLLGIDKSLINSHKRSNIKKIKYFRNAKEILHNSMGGHMLRTKIHTANEGGGKVFFMIIFTC